MIILEQHGRAVRVQLTDQQYHAMSRSLRSDVDGQPGVLVWCSALGHVAVPVELVSDAPTVAVRKQLSD